MSAKILSFGRVSMKQFEESILAREVSKDDSVHELHVKKRGFYWEVN